MKQTITLILLTLSLNCFSQSQLEMNIEANEGYDESDKELNEVYKKVLQLYKSDTAFISALKKTQRIWISFRDAELEMKFPGEKKRLQYGSVYPMCVSLFLKGLTDNRAETLRNLLIGVDEGDICQGAMKTRPIVDQTYANKVIIEKDSTVWLMANTKKDHRIFGYQNPNLKSKKLLLLSVFTNEVKDNPFALKYGAYYDTDGMNELKLKLASTTGDFVEVKILQGNNILDNMYIEKHLIEFKK